MLTSPVYAQERAYQYDAILYEIAVQKDASIEVTEKQVYRFSGEYHQGVRSIPHKAIGAITDVTVSDENGTAYRYVNDRLEKTDPASWGAYTVYDTNGYTYIEWYYDVNGSETQRTWIVRYTVHGAVTFYNDHDELYWNLFTEYDVPIERIEAIVRLPVEATLPSQQIYRSGNGPSVAEVRGDRFLFAALNIAPREAVTIAAGWQKGVVSKAAFWRDLLNLYWAYALSVLVILASLIYSFTHWYFTERYHKGRGTIIPEYEPPKGLRPAMVQLIVKERLGTTAWPATIVDLAVRGYVKILATKKETGIRLYDRWFPAHEYRVEKLREWSDDLHLEDYEKEFLDLIFADKGYFSTKEFRKEMQTSMTASWNYQKKMRALTKTLYAETSVDTGAYEVPLTVRNWVFTRSARVASSLWPLGFGFAAAAFLIFGMVRGNVGYVVVASALVIAALIVYVTTKLNPRLNAKGFRLREDCLGFKLFLETAERHRMQNLTPDLFEKYLPYAMIFGIEKKWAKAFESMHLPQPAWYGASHPAIYASSSGGAPSFSPSVFSASFASSFTSVFASSAGSGASGGGGGAGGGGGGGGGGAS